MIAVTRCGLSRELLRGTRSVDSEAPTPTQQGVIPLAFGGVGVIVTCETGSGTTATSLRPLPERVHDGRTRAPILISPTSEVAAQSVARTHGTSV